MSEGGDWLKRMLGGVLLAVGILIALTGGVCGGLLVLISPPREWAGGIVMVALVVLLGVGLIIAGRKLGGRTAAEMDAGLSFRQRVRRRLAVAFGCWVLLQVISAGFAVLA